MVQMARYIKTQENVSRYKTIKESVINVLERMKKLYEKLALIIL